MYKKINQTCIHAVRSAVLHANAWLGNYSEVIWLIGDGRSGTTWVASLINHDKKYREMFEPFHPNLVKETQFLLPHQYVRPEESNEQLKSIASRIFYGKFAHPRVDAGNRSLVYNGLLVKDIFVNLLAYWAAIHFPHIKILLLIRNPFAVALSKSKRKDWFWATDPMALMNQVGLYEDYLYPFKEIIIETIRKNDFILNQVLIWSIIHYVPLHQFDQDRLYVVFYEDIHANPDNEISRLYESGLHRTPGQSEIDAEIIHRPSKFAGSESNILHGNSPVTSWKKELPVQQIDAGLRILQEFGFDTLYDDACMPNRQALGAVFSQKE